MARSTSLSVKEDLSSRLEQIDLPGCGGIFQQPGSQVHGCPWGPGVVEVRALLDRCTSAWWKRWQPPGEDRGMGTGLRTRKESRSVAEELLAVIELT